MNLYQDHILDHYHNPRHFGFLKESTHQSEALNPTCGDKLAITLLIEDGTIKDLGFEGEGCAISLASASLLYDTLIGTKMTDACQKEPSDVLSLTGLAISPGRMKCALLSLETLKKALCAKIES
ncbi:MAG: iron-sulfur cluster assembly scaffold protein [Candidatus Moranbacteria bacterium]|nr:iron-sulfur cluster assembly scaffold protein [Candidatus Moranbacteria bacterium]